MPAVGRPWPSDDDDDDPIKINPMTTLKIKSFMINDMSLCQRLVFHEHNFDGYKYEIDREKEDDL